MLTSDIGDLGEGGSPSRKTDEKYYQMIENSIEKKVGERDRERTGEQWRRWDPVFSKDERMGRDS